MKKPFRWTKRAKNIRDAFRKGMSKDDIMKLVTDSLRNQPMRASEMAMTVSDWSLAIDDVAARTGFGDEPFFDDPNYAAPKETT